MMLEMQARSSDGYAMDWLWPSLYHALAMLWATFWALVMGFTISGVLQVFVSKEQMSRAFGRTNLKSISLATGLGAASSSCSYAAVAAARSAIQQGAAFIPALAFMFASTNLVIELGAVLWVLMGWQFVLAEILGAFVLIAIMWLLIRLFLPKNLETEMRIRVQEKIQSSNHCRHEHEHAPSSNAGAASEQEFATANPSVGGHEMSKWTRVARAFVMDWSMLWEHSARQFALVARHQFRRCDFFYLRRPDCHSDQHHLRQILRDARCGLDYRNFLRLDGSCRNHRRPRFQRDRLDSPGIASAERGGACAHHLELHLLPRFGSSRLCNVVIAFASQIAGQTERLRVPLKLGGTCAVMSQN